jgi:hypothetical protein
MKKITVIALIIVAAMLLNFAQSFAQTSVTATQQGNTLTQVKEVKVPKTEAELIEGATKTELMFQPVDKDNKPVGQKLPVYKSETGKSFVLRTAKESGNLYRQYITTKQ